MVHLTRAGTKSFIGRKKTAPAEAKAVHCSTLRQVV